MAAVLDATLNDLMWSEDLDTLDDRNQWMLMTWDMVKISAESRITTRVFLSLTETVITASYHEPDTYLITEPRPGKTFGRATSGDFPLRLASRTTEESAAQGFTILCRPLAVDCSPLAGQIVSDGRLIESTGHLVRGIASGSATGIEALRAVNRARSHALSTHLNPEWRNRIASGSEYELWNGIA